MSIFHMLFGGPSEAEEADERRRREAARAPMPKVSVGDYFTSAIPSSFMTTMPANVFLVAAGTQGRPMTPPCGCSTWSGHTGGAPSDTVLGISVLACPMVPAGMIYSLPNRCFSLGPGDIVRLPATEAPDDDRFGYKAKAAEARADAAARGLTEGYWWARWQDDMAWEPVKLVTAEIEGIEPYLEVWDIGRDYADDLVNYAFLSKIAAPDHIG